MSKSSATLLFLSAALSGMAHAECDVGSVPSCELVRDAEYATVTEACDVQDIAAAAARRELAGNDVIELAALAADPTTVTANDRFCVSKAEMSDGGDMARVDLLIKSAQNRDRRFARWFRVQRTGWYWETVQAVAPGAIVSAEDVQLRYGAVNRFPRLALKNWPENVRATAALGLGTAIANGDIEMTPLVGVGDSLELHVQSGPILMALKARSLTDAASGEFARLTLEHNGERTYAILLDQNTAIPCRLPLRDRIDDCDR